MASMQLAFDILARDAASATFDKVGDSAGRLSKAGVAVGSAIGGLAAGGITAGLSAVKNFAAGSVDAFARVEDATAAAGVTFGSQLPAITDFATKAASGFGISKGAALDAALTFGTLGKAAGLTGTDLSGFSTQFAGLAGDLASFRGTSTEQAIEAVGAALRGESEPIRAYGVLLDDASLRQEALAQGLIKTTNQALTPQQKVLATQALILAQTSAATGDYARTAESTANVQKTLAAETENAQAVLGQRLAPAITAAREGFLALIQGSTGVIGFIGGLAATVQPLVESLSGGLQPALAAVGSALADFASVIPTPVLKGAAVVVGVLTAAFLVQTAATSALSVATGVATAAKGLFITTTNVETGVTTRGTIARLAHNVSAVAGAVAQGVFTAAKVVGTVATVALTAATTALGVAIRVATGPVGLIITALAALAAGLVFAYKNSETFRNIVDGAFAAVKAAAQAMANFITSTIPAAFAKAKDGAASAVGALLSVVGGLPGRILGALGNLGSLLFSAGGDLLRGLANGIGAAVGNVAAAAKRAAQAVVNAVKGAFGINSPSRVMAALGRNVSEGLAVGINDRAGLAQNALSGLLPPTMTTSVKSDRGGSVADLLREQNELLRRMPRDYQLGQRQMAGAQMAGV